MNETVNQQERLLDLAWIAGLWEGEGNFSLFRGSKNRIYAAATIVNGDFSLIEEVHNALVKLGVGHYINTRKLSLRNSNHKDVKVLYVVGYKRVRSLLNVLRPFLRGHKRDVAAAVMEFVEYRMSIPKGIPYTAKEFELLEIVRALNKKGPKESSETIRQTAKAEDIVQVV